MVPQIYDQHYFASRIDALEIGAAHAPGVPSAESLTAPLARARGPDGRGRPGARAPDPA